MSAFGGKVGHSPRWVRHTFKNSLQICEGFALAREERILGVGEGVAPLEEFCRSVEVWIEVWIGAKAQIEN